MGIKVEHWHKVIFWLQELQFHPNSCNSYFVQSLSILNGCIVAQINIIYKLLYSALLVTIKSALWSEHYTMTSCCYLFSSLFDVCPSVLTLHWGLAPGSQTKPAGHTWHARGLYCNIKVPCHTSDHTFTALTKYLCLMHVLKWLRHLILDSTIFLNTLLCGMSKVSKSFCTLRALRVNQWGFKNQSDTCKIIALKLNTGDILKIRLNIAKYQISLILRWNMPLHHQGSTWEWLWFSLVAWQEN